MHFGAKRYLEEKHIPAEELAACLELQDASRQRFYGDAIELLLAVWFGIGIGIGVGYLIWGAAA